MRGDNFFPVHEILRVVDLGLLLPSDRLDHLCRLEREQPRVLKDGHSLLSCDERLHIRQVGILPREHRHRTRRRAVTRVLQRGDDAERDGVVRREYGIEIFVALILLKQRCHALLCHQRRPAGRRALFLRALPRANRELPLVDVRLQHIHCARIEHLSVAVLHGARRDLERALFPLRKTELVHNGLCLHPSDSIAVERRIVIDRIRPHEEAVIGDDGHPRLLRALNHRAEHIAVHRSDDKHLAALADHLLELRLLLFRVVVRKHDVDIEIAPAQLRLEIRAVPVPSEQLLCRHRDAHLCPAVVARYDVRSAAARETQYCSDKHRIEKNSPHSHTIILLIRVSSLCRKSHGCIVNDRIPFSHYSMFSSYISL